MQNQRNQLQDRWEQTQKVNKPKSLSASALEKHRRLILGVIGALVVFIILHRVWFYVMGAFAVIGAVWVIREYNKNEERK